MSAELADALAAMERRALAAEADWQAAEQQASEAEQRWRRLLWLHHGHEGIYGDDGERGPRSPTVPRLLARIAEAVEQPRDAALLQDVRDLLALLLELSLQAHALSVPPDLRDRTAARLRTLRGAEPSDGADPEGREP